MRSQGRVTAQAQDTPKPACSELSRTILYSMPSRMRVMRKTLAASPLRQAVALSSPSEQRLSKRKVLTSKVFLYQRGLAPRRSLHDVLPQPTSCCMTCKVRVSAMSDAIPKTRPAPRKGIAVDLARALIAAYRMTLSPLVGNRCRHLPTCSQYADEAIECHGFWAGGWMTLARLLRCHPFGTSGLDFVARTLPADARWYRPWRYGRWRGVNDRP
jgi:uncharacterized protein